MQRRYRVVVAKPGPDAHDRGARTIARALRDAGFEVIDTGLVQTPDQIVATTIQEDADAAALSLLPGADLRLFPLVAQKLREQGVDDVVLFGDGIVAGCDAATLTSLGGARLFDPGAPLDTITSWLATTLDSRELASS